MTYLLLALLFAFILVNLRDDTSFVEDFKTTALVLGNMALFIGGLLLIVALGWVRATYF
jgi:hypothetical protein